uniref:Exostosin-1-like n=2 Tax=Hirondellea gigas TaxID=1518452 RepID=A0A6A7G333_9CRUS
MQAKKRYLLLMSCCAFLSIGYFGYYHWKNAREDRLYGENLVSYVSDSDTLQDEDISANPRARTRLSSDSDNLVHSSSNNYKNNDIPFFECRMENCFDFTRCEGDFRVYVYPIDENVAPSSSYMKVLNVIQESKYYTSDASQACVFVLSLDTLDRDNLSKDYVRNMPRRIQRLPLWNGGQNHIIFNLYSGTWPDYNEDLGFSIGKAILAKASIAIENFRPNFDISLPLFHKTHPTKGGEDGTLKSLKFPGNKKYLLAFKGKRYVYGIGSEARNSLYHLHNEKDIVLITTCKHGGSWKEHQDERCDHDNAEYDRWDYEELLHNSTFCLVPRGRRLGSFRFLEVLSAGCVPVLLANGWELPFAEVIDWAEATLHSDERLLLQVPELVRSVQAAAVLRMRQQSQLLYNQYFSSVSSIVHTTLEIVYERVRRHRPRPLKVWNSHPGALAVNLSYSDNLNHFPFYASHQHQNKFTAVVFVSHGGGGPSLHTTPLYRLLKNIARSKYVAKIVVLWGSRSHPLPNPHRLPSGGVPLHLLLPPTPSPSHRHLPRPEVSTAAVFALDEDATLTTDELDFAFSVWKSFPDRIVGYPARNYVYSQSGSYHYSSSWSNSYSLVLTGAAVYHHYYQHMYQHYSPPQLLAAVAHTANCDDILMNIIVSSVTRRPPVKLTQRKHYKDPSSESSRLWSSPSHFAERTTCLNTFSSVLGRLPLHTSQVRLDPVLYRDNVSVKRKKFRQIDKIGPGS